MLDMRHVDSESPSDVAHWLRSESADLWPALLDDALRVKDPQDVCHEQRSLFAAPDQRVVGDFPGVSSRGRKADARLSRLSGPQLAGVRHLRPDQDGLGRGI